jgi:hypothetical protein
MVASFRRLDELLRGRLTSPQSLAEGRLKLSLRQFVPLAALLGTTYGFFMGWYAISLYWGGSVPEPSRMWQILASSVKLPMLFMLTLVVTFPSLYVFNALFGCRAGFVDTLRLLVGAVTVNVAIAASLGPILGFFTLSTTSYPFMVLLNVVLLGIAGFVALAFLLQTLRRLAPPIVEATPARPPVAPPPIEPMHDSTDLDPREIGAIIEEVGPLDRPPPGQPPQAFGQAKTVFQIWLLIYALVGAQMGWILRPFIGSPSLPFQWFRPRSGNFFQAVLSSIHSLLGMN